MIKLEALDRNTVRNIRIVGDTVYAEASIDWPAMYSTDHPGQPAIEILVVAAADIEEHPSTEEAVDCACLNAVDKLNMAFEARFPEMGTDTAPSSSDFLPLARAL